MRVCLPQSTTRAPWWDYSTLFYPQSGGVGFIKCHSNHRQREISQTAPLTIYTPMARSYINIITFLADYHERFNHVEETDLRCSCGVRRAQLHPFICPDARQHRTLFVVQGAQTTVRTIRIYKHERRCADFAAVGTGNWPFQERHEFKPRWLSYWFLGVFNSSWGFEVLNIGVSFFFWEYPLRTSSLKGLFGFAFRRAYSISAN